MSMFGMPSSKPIKTPSAANIPLTTMFAPKLDENKEYMSRVSSVNAVGNLMYVMVCMRHDLAYAIAIVSRLMAQPGRM